MASLLSVNYLKKYAKQYFIEKMYTQADQCFIIIKTDIQKWDCLKGRQSLEIFHRLENDRVHTM